MATPSSFKAEFPFGTPLSHPSNTTERRVEVSQKIRIKYPDRVPVIVEKGAKAELVCTKRKFLVPQEITIGAFMHEIRKHLVGAEGEEKAIFLFVGEQIPPAASLMSELYERYQDEDGFIYLTYTTENTFG